MRLMNWDPFRELEDLHQAADRLLNPKPVRHRRRLDYPPLDVLEDEDGFVVIANLPGMDKDQLQISLLGQTLKLEGERSVGNGNGHRYLRRERGHGKFRRTVEFRTEVEPDSIKAKYHDGVLSVSVPKTESAKPKQITVSVEE